MKLIEIKPKYFDINGHWRIDVKGKTIYVVGKQAYDHMIEVNAQLNKYKLALNKINLSNTDPEIEAMVTEVLKG